MKRMFSSSTLLQSLAGRQKKLSLVPAHAEEMFLEPRTSLVEWRLLEDSLSGTKEFELFWLPFSHAGRLSACVPNKVTSICL